ncbi:hypothetical protein PTUN_a1807 [Pseudoalteromonas tunicata]|nr:hypothetical protein PTUN_a1807 [Pseudoalteromonas tunicata]
MNVLNSCKPQNAKNQTKNDGLIAAKIINALVSLANFRPSI